MTQAVSSWYNIVVFTASLAEYAAPVIDALDPRETKGARVLVRGLHACIVILIASSSTQYDSDYAPFLPRIMRPRVC